MGVPKELVLKLKAASRLTTFIETGTFYGHTAAWAAKHFDQVFTIEIDETISKRAAEKMSNSNSVNYLVGDSETILPELVAELNSPAFFWLDGHYSGPGTGGESNECPLLSELQPALAVNGSVVMIDDARCFLGSPPPPHNSAHWPRVDDIFQHIKQLAPAYGTTIHDDVIIAVPPELMIVLDEDWLENFDSRFHIAQPKGGWRGRLRRLME